MKYLPPSLTHLAKPITGGAPVTLHIQGHFNCQKAFSIYYYFPVDSPSWWLVAPPARGVNLYGSGKELDRGGASTFTAAQVLDHLWYELTNVPEFGTKY